MNPRFNLCLASLVVALGGLTTLRADSPAFLVRNWRNEDGLPHSVINSIVQTRDGYLWIGMFVGLVRFDGVRFVYYSSSTVPQMDSELVSKLFEDRDGTLWVGLENGGLLAWKNGMARTHLRGGSVFHEAIVSMAQDRQGVIWLQTDDGQIGRLTETGAEVVARDDGLLTRSSRDLVVDQSGRLWVGTHDGLKLWNNGAFVPPPGLESFKGKVPDAFAAARDGSIWMFLDGRLCKVKSGKVTQFAGPPKFADPAVVLTETSDGRVWVASADGGLFCVLPGGEWQTVPKEGLRGPNRALCEDREGNLWRGSFGGGLTQIRPPVFARHELPRATLDQYAYSVAADSAGNIWEVQDSSSRTLARIPAGTASVEECSGAAVPRGIRTLLVDRHGSLWTGTDDGLLSRLIDNKPDAQINVSGREDYINALYEDDQTNLWVGFSQGAGVGALPQDDPKKWRLLGGVPFADVRCIAKTADGAMWFGTHYGGVCRLKDDKWSRFTRRDGLPSDYIRCLRADADGTLWLGTFHGICRWRNGKFVAITTASGLWNDFVSEILEDGGGNFWLSSFGGIFHVPRAQLNDFADGRRESVQCVGYDRHDGLPNVECPGGFQPAGAKTPDGRLWFPTVDGLVSVDPARLRENKLPPPVRMEEVLVDGAVNSIDNSGTLVIGPGKRRYDFRFTGLSFTAPEKVRFRHKLEGLDPDWSQPDDQRSAAYNHVPPGRYTFRVMACNNDGIWNEAGAEMALVVRPFFWQTVWFKGGMAVFLALSIAIAVRRVERWKARQRLQRVEQQHAIERERSRIAKDIHDDLGAHLTQIVFLSQRAEGASHDAGEVARWIQMIPATARRTLRSLDEIVWAINPRHDSLESLANYLSQFVPEYLTLAGVRGVLDVPTVLPPLMLGAELRHNLVLAVREAVQNAVTHATAGEVSVKLQLDGDGLTITIADNGVGFDMRTVKGDGNGLPNMQRRLEEIGGKAEIAGKPGAGTTVRLFVPGPRLHGRVIGRNGGRV